MKRKYIVTDHGNDKTYDITELDPNGYPIYTKPKEQIDTVALIREAESLIEYNKRQKGETKQQEPVKTKRELELERNAKEWEQYFKQNPSKIRYNIFEEIEHAFDY
jgi:hypothetical protein